MARQSRCLGCMREIKLNNNICTSCGYVVGTPAKEPLHLSPGTYLIKRYLLGRVLGYGGFGITYLAWDNILNQKVAIKEYFPGDFATRTPGDKYITIFSGEPEIQYNTGLQSFVDEARKLAQYIHIDGIVSIYNVFELNQTAYMVMEYVEGDDVKKVIKKHGGKLTFKETMKIIIPLLETLKVLHNDGLIHRDISPDNIYLTNDGRVKLLDFGAARYATTSRSKSLSVILKPGYAPEEQYSSKGIQGTWTDVYAVGATMYKMLTGLLPDESLERMINDTLVGPSKCGVKIPIEAETAILNALIVKSDQRTQNAEVFLSQITGNIKAERIIVKREKKDNGRWPVWLKSLTIAAALLLVLAPLTFFLVKQYKTPINIPINNIPNIIGMDKNDVYTLLSNAGIKYIETGTEYSVFAQKDIVLSQKPSAGEYVDENTVVEFKICSGHKYADVPDLVYMDANKATTLLDEIGFKYYIKEEHNDFAPNTISSQNVDAMSSYALGKKIVLTKSLGVLDIELGLNCQIPSVVSKGIDTAKNLVLSSDLYLTKEYEVWDERAPSGTIIEQSPVYHDESTTGEVVRVVVSKGPEQVLVPSVIGKNKNKAIELLTDKGFDVSIEYSYDENYQNGYIIKQSIEANTVIDILKHNFIAISVSYDHNIEWQDTLPEEVIENSNQYTIETKEEDGHLLYWYTKQDANITTKKTESSELGLYVPDISSLSQSQARDMINNIGLTYQVVGSEFSDSVPAGRILKYSPDKGTLLKKHDLVEVIISAGKEYIIMPDVRYKDANEAVRTLNVLGFIANIKEKQSDYLEGIVIEQNISPYTKVKKGKRITIVKSTNSSKPNIGEECVLTDITGMDISAASTLLLNNSLFLINIDCVWSDIISAGKIVEYRTQESTLTSDVIEVIVSKGAERIIVPYLFYKTQQEAVLILDKLGFDTTIDYEYSDDVEEGRVINQGINPYKILTLNDNEVVLTISLGKEWSPYKLEVPRFVLNNTDVFEVNSKEQYRYSSGAYVFDNWGEWQDNRRSLRSPGVTSIDDGSGGEIHINVGPDFEEDKRTVYSYRLNPFKTYKWSEWVESLPEVVLQNLDKYEIQEKIQYRYIDSIFEYYSSTGTSELHTYQNASHVGNVVMAWQDNKLHTTDYRREETRIVYSYKKKK